MKRVLAIWLPDWPLQRLVSKRPELIGRPVILESASHQGQRVVACSMPAFERGIRVGMLVAEAMGLEKSGLNGINGPNGLGN